MQSSQPADRPARHLIEFLKGDELHATVEPYGDISRERAKELLQDLVPCEIQVRGVCRRRIKAVVSAPHVSFDHWSEYFCNRVAREFDLGWVVGLNYRDRDQLRIPVNIGRHIHVNRPTESDGPGRIERQTDRAARVYESYLKALQEAAASGDLPIDLLIEIHSHRRTTELEIATTGVDAEMAAAILRAFADTAATEESSPKLLIEPLHALRMQARTTKRLGAMQASVASCGLHIEIPRQMRNSVSARERALPRLFAIVAAAIRVTEERNLGADFTL